MAVPEKQQKHAIAEQPRVRLTGIRIHISIQVRAGGFVHRIASRPLSTIPHAKNPMPDPNTSPVKPERVYDPENGADDIQLYDHSDAASSRSGLPFPTRTHSRGSAATSTSTERFLRRTGFSAFYYNPVTQVCLLGLVCFLCPGSFNALNGLGAAGRVDSGVNSNSNSALYATFTACAFFAG